MSDGILDEARQEIVDEIKNAYSLGVQDTLKSLKLAFRRIPVTGIDADVACNLLDRLLASTPLEMVPRA